jgi:hypothetical protein
MRSSALPAATVLGLALALALSVGGPLEAQCPMCRTALTESPEGQKMAQGFNRGILFLLGAPYLVFGTIAGSIWYSRRRSQRNAQKP